MKNHEAFVAKGVEYAGVKKELSDVVGLREKLMEQDSQLNEQERNLRSRLNTLREELTTMSTTLEVPAPLI